MFMASSPQNWGRRRPVAADEKMELFGSGDNPAERKIIASNMEAIYQPLSQCGWPR
jgi:hypothetical protein